MNYLVDALIRSSVLLLAGLAAAVLLRGRSAALRHWLLAATVAAAAIAAPLSWILPAWPAAAVRTPAALANTWRVPQERSSPNNRRADANPARVAAAPAGAGPAAPIRQLPLGLVWALGFAIGVGALLVQIGRLARLSRRAVPVTDERWLRIVDEVRRRHAIRQPVPVLQTSSVDLLATWGLFQPRIL